MDKEQKQQQNPVSDSSIFWPSFIYQPAYQWQPENSELKNELLLICQYLKSLTERQEQLYLQINYGHEQIRRECGQYFQILFNLLTNKTESQNHTSHAQERFEEDVKGSSKTDENLTAGLKMPIQPHENISFQNNNSDYIVTTKNKPNPTELPQKKQSSLMPESTKEKDMKFQKHGLEWQIDSNNDMQRNESNLMLESKTKKQDIQNYQTQTLTDSGHDWKMDKAKPWNVHEHKALSGINKIQQDSKIQDTQLLSPEDHSEKQYFISGNNNVLKEENMDTSGSHQSLPEAGFDNLKDRKKDETKYLEGQKEKLKKKNTEKGRPQFHSIEVETKMESVKELKEEIKSVDQKSSQKLYTDAVLTDCSPLTNFQISPLLDKNIPNKLQQNFDIADNPENEESFQGTGFYAEVISKQLANRAPSPAGSAHSSLSLKENFENPQMKNTYIPTYGAEFQIIKSKEFSASDKKFLTPYMYTRIKACKVRVCIFFNKAGHLNASFHVARGIFDDKIKWPVILSGSGLILNNGSKRFESIFQLQPRPCKKPLSDEGEMILQAAVCLSSSRSSHQEVTYKDLEKKHYAGNNCLTFKWKLEAA